MNKQRVSKDPFNIGVVQKLKKHDVIVVECTESMTTESMEEIYVAINEIWPGQKCLVLDKTLSMSIVKHV